MKNKNKEFLSFKSRRGLCEFLDTYDSDEKFLFFYGPTKVTGPFILVPIQNDLNGVDFSYLRGVSKALSFDFDLFLHVSKSSVVELLGFSLEENDENGPGFLALNNDLLGDKKLGLKRVYQESSVYKDCYREIGVAFMGVETLKRAFSLSRESKEGFLFTDAFFDQCPFVEGIPLPQKTSEKIKGMAKRPALFLDRDGIINEDLGYVGSKDKVQFIEGVFPLIQFFKEKGWWIFVITNQAGVARRFFSEKDVVSLHKWMASEMKKRGAEVDGWFYCPFHPKGEEPLLKRKSLFRKPNPGMLLSAAEKYSIHLGKSLMIGDKLSDIISLRGLTSNLIQGRYPLEGATVPCFQSHDELVGYYLKIQD